MTTWNVPGIVTRIIDGDTLVADLDLGWRVWMRDARVRLSDRNAPEMRDPGGPEAKLALEGEFPVGSRVMLESRSLDKYGRCLGVLTPVP